MPELSELPYPGKWKTVLTDSDLATSWRSRSRTRGARSPPRIRHRRIRAICFPGSRTRAPTSGLGLDEGMDSR